VVAFFSPDKAGFAAGCGATAPSTVPFPVAKKDVKTTAATGAYILFLTKSPSLGFTLYLGEHDSADWLIKFLEVSAQSML
jgi:hypothetical protein